MTQIEKKAVFIGVIFIITITLSIAGYQYLKGNNPLKKDRYFYAVFDNIQGLDKTAPVTVNGLKVGQVIKISFNPGNKKIIVLFAIENKNIKIPQGSVAQIYSMDLLGTKALRILLSNNQKFIKTGDTLQTSLQPEPYELLISRIPEIDSILYNTAQIIQKINSAITPQLINSISAAAQKLQHTISILDTTIGKNSQLQQSIANLNYILLQIKTQTASIQQIIQNTKNLTDTLQQLNLQNSINKLNASLDNLNQILTSLKHGQGTAGQLLTNDTLYKRIDTLMQNLNYILGKLR